MVDVVQPEVTGGRGGLQLPAQGGEDDFHGGFFLQNEIRKKNCIQFIPLQPRVRTHFL